jgi:VanZ family protein
MNADHDISDCRKCFYLRLFAVLFWTVALVLLSILPVTTPSLYLFKGQDKLLHFMAYLLAAWLMCRSMQLFAVGVTKTVYISVFYCFILGALLEVIQRTYITSRQGEWLDLAANMAGAICGCAIFCLQRKLTFSHHEK